MTAIQFYHLTATPLERALPKLLEKAYAGGMRSVVLAADDERAEKLNQLLWTYDASSFLPHGSVRDGQTARLPILLAAEVPAGHEAALLVVTDGRRIDETGGYERVLDLFDGNDPSAVEQARSRWSAYKAAGHEMVYRRQNASGGWEAA